LTVSETTNIELERRYRATAMIVSGQILLTIGLAAAAWLLAGQVGTIVPAAWQNGLWIAGLSVAIGAFLLRRVLFAPAALRDAATLRGASGLLASLQAKTIILAALAEAVAVIGFVITLSTGDIFDMLRASAVALIVFMISFPRKNAWRRVVEAASK
jgi:hypothetical protein